MTKGRDLRDLRKYSEENLIVKRTKLIEYQNQISWIACEFRKMQIGELSVYDEDICVILYEHLNNLMENMREEGLDSCLRNEYLSRVNKMLDTLKSQSSKRDLLSGLKLV